VCKRDHKWQVIEVEEDTVTNMLPYKGHVAGVVQTARVSGKEQLSFGYTQTDNFLIIRMTIHFIVIVIIPLSSSFLMAIRTVFSLCPWYSLLQFTLTAHTISNNIVSHPNCFYNELKLQGFQSKHNFII